MRPERTLSRGQLRELERALRSARARLEQAMGRTLARHQELVAAIRRLETGTYGVCLDCEGPIEYECLVRSPKATHCAECAARVARQDGPFESRRSITQSKE